MINQQEILPAQPLRPYIHRYVILENNTLLPFTFQEFFPPNFSKILVFHYVEERDIRVENQTFAENIPLAFIQFQGKEKFQFKFQKRFGFIVIIFRPGQFRHFFPFAAREYINSYLSLDDYNDKSLLELHYKILEASNNENRITLLNEFFLSLLRRISIKENKTDEMLHLMLTQDEWKLFKTSKMLKVSERHLRRLFVRDIGISPKQLHKLFRFTKVLTKLTSLQFDSLKQLAYSTGYADPNHFIEHFKVFTGFTPSAYIKKQFPGVDLFLDVNKTNLAHLKEKMGIAR